MMNLFFRKDYLYHFTIKEPDIDIDSEFIAHCLDVAEGHCTFSDVEIIDGIDGVKTLDWDMEDKDYIKGLYYIVELGTKTNLPEYYL